MSFLIIFLIITPAVVFFLFLHSGLNKKISLVLSGIFFALFLMLFLGLYAVNKINKQKDSYKKVIRLQM